MSDFRERTPIRRSGRTKCSHWSAYRNDLRVDFNQRCGYCDDLDSFRVRPFAIDHFIPRNPKSKAFYIDDCEYSNLVYSCHSCNSAKSNKWPTNDPLVHNDWSVGFVEPTTDDYWRLFKRNEQGKIISSWINDTLAKHLIDELNLWTKLHSIMWKIERLNNLLEIINWKLNCLKDEDVEYTAELKSIKYELLEGYHEVTTKLFSSVNA